MFKSLLKKAGLFCLLSTLFVLKGNASYVGWYFDPNNGIYSIIDVKESFLGTTTSGNPYYVTMPQNIASGEEMKAYFRMRCSQNTLGLCEITASAKDVKGNTLSGCTVKCNKKSWSSVAVFDVAETTRYFDFVSSNSLTLTKKYIEFFVPVPRHLDISDQVMPNEVNVGEEGLFNVRLNSFFTDEDNQTITLTKTGDNEDFEIVRGTLNMAHRCGSDKRFGTSQEKYFVNTKDENNMFVVRFKPTVGGEQTCTFLVSNGSQSKQITLTASGYGRNAEFYAVGNGHIELSAGGGKGITTSPYYFRRGERMRFVAVPDRGYRFVRFDFNKQLVTTPEISIVGNESFILRAIFEPERFSVHAISDDVTHGTVAIRHAKSTEFNYGQDVEVMAKPAPGYVFVGWSHCNNPETIISKEPEYVFTVEDDICLEAHFALDDGFRIICEADSGVTVVYDDSYPYRAVRAKLLYSTDRMNWTRYTTGTPITLANKGDVLYFKAVNTNKVVGGWAYEHISFSNDSLIPAFTFSDSVSVAGNLLYLIANDAENAVMVPHVFRTLFAVQPVIYADQLIMPADTLPYEAFHSMFRGCEKLKTAPELPSTNLGNGCYAFMFMNCTSLEVASELPSSRINKNAYIGMFHGCTSLTAAPTMNTNFVGTQGCEFMFDSCVNLVDIQNIVLGAMKVSSESYAGMFRNCYSLTQAPALPATTLSDNCYKYMFENCVLLTEAPALPATQFYENCYKEMFKGCTNLSKIEVAFSAFVRKFNPTVNWTKDVAPQGVFIAPNMQPEDYQYNTDTYFGYIPQGWVVNPVQNAPRHNSVETQYVAIAEGMNIVVRGAEDVNVTVYDMSGRIISTIAKASDVETISIAVPGVYVVKVEGQKSTSVLVK